MGGDQLGQPETDTIDDATSRISQRLQQTYYQLDLITIGIKKYAESLGQRANNLRELEDLERLYFSIKNLNDKIQEAAVHYRKVSSAQA